MGEDLLERSLIKSLNWLIKLRWYAVGGVFSIITGSRLVLGIDLPILPLYIGGMILLTYNIIFFQYNRKLRTQIEEESFLKKAKRFANLQISLDLAFVAYLVYFSGGIENPFVFYFIFHMVITSILLSNRAAYLQASFVVALLIFMSVGVYYGYLPHYHLNGFIEGEFYNQSYYLAGIFFVFISTIYLMVYMATFIVNQLRKRERELVATKEAAEVANRALYRIDKFMESMSDQNKLLELIISEGRNAIDAEACSLALYDEAQNEIYFDIATGKEGEDELERKLKDIRMRMGDGIVGWTAVNMQPLSVTDVYNDPRFYKEVDKETGFITQSILAVPMVRRGELIGVIEAINKRNQKGFPERDERVLTVLAAQAALVIENARLYEENLQKARLSALGQGIAGAAHFVKNILNGIDAGAYILERGIKKESIDEIAKGWDIMKRNKGRMKNLVLDMLSYSKDRKPEYELTDVNELCQDAVETMRQKAKENNVEILFDPSSDLCKIFLDAKGIYRCILNLVSNAIDACDKPQCVVEITIRIVEADKWFEIVISDNGCGISKENLKKLFTSFFSTKGSKGTGLGLAITEKIISEHGGHINVESELGEGTTFTIKLPINQHIP